MGRLLVYLALILIAGLLSLIFGRKKPKYPQMIQCAAGQFGKFIMYAFALLMAAFGVFVFVVSAADDSAWEEAGGMLLLVFALLIFIIVMFLIMGRAVGQRYVYYDEEKLIIGRTFGADQTLAWHEIGEVRPIGRGGTAMRLFDRNGKKCFIANTSMDNYYQFYETAMRKVHGGVQEGPMTPGRR